MARIGRNMWGKTSVPFLLLFYIAAVRTKRGMGSMDYLEIRTTEGKLRGVGNKKKITGC
jgi:hypothetical protein